MALYKQHLKDMHSDIISDLLCLVVFRVLFLLPLYISLFTVNTYRFITSKILKLFLAFKVIF